MPPAASHSILPRGSQLLIFRICTLKRSIYNTVLPGFQASLSAQPMLLGESLGRSNRSGSKTSQACYGHPRCNVNLVRLFRFPLHLRVLGVFSSSLTHASINLQPPSQTMMYQTPGSSAAVLQSPVMPNSRRSSAAQSVHSFSLPFDPRFSPFSSSPDMTLLGDLWSPMRSSACDHNLLVRPVVSMLARSVCWTAQ